MILWNSNSALPSGLLPTILDRAIGAVSSGWTWTRGSSMFASEDGETPPAAVRSPLAARPD